MTSDHLPYGRHSVTDEDVARVVGVLVSDWLTTGPTVSSFEVALSRVAGGHPVVALNSGTAALHAAYAAAGVGPETEVVVPPMTFAATATAALHLGATVRFADVDDETLLLDPVAAAEAAGAKTRVVTAVDFAGQPADVPSLRSTLDGSDLTIIVDASHSIGGRVGDEPVGAIGDMTTFSFHPVKTITTGEGGAVVVRESEYLEHVRRFRNHGLVRERGELLLSDEGPWHQEVQSLGLNYRMPDINAALGLSQLERLHTLVQRRAELVARYRAHLEDIDGLRLLHQREGVTPAWHLFPVRVLGGRRREVFEGLQAVGIGVQVHYLPVHLHPLFRELGHGPGELPVAEAAYTELISLPLFPDLAEAQQDRVIAEIRALLGP